MNENELFTLTLTQKDIYFEHLKNLDTPLHNIGGFIRIKNGNIDKLRAAHRALVSSEEIFGLRIVTLSEEPMQTIAKDRNAELPVIDLSAINDEKKEDVEKKADVWIKKIFEVPLRIESDRLFQAFLLKIDDDECRYVGLAHHIMMDGWGFSNWAHQLSVIYQNTEQCDRDNHVLSAQWKTMPVEESSYLVSDKYKRDKNYWEQQTFDLKPLLIPFYRHRFGVNKKSPSIRKLLTISPQQLQRLSIITNQYAVSASSIYLATLMSYFALAYSRSTINVGLPFHNRRNYRQKKMLGVFASISPTSVTVERTASFIEVAKQIANKQKSNFRHQQYPFGQIRSHHLPSGAEQSMFDITMSYLKLGSQLSFEGENADLVYVSNNHEVNPLAVTVWDYGSSDDTTVQFDCNLAYFDELEANALVSRFSFLVDQVLDNAEMRIGQMNCVPREERLQIAKTSLYNSSFIHTLFEAQVEKTPENVALVFQEKVFTYRELNDSANQLAQHLQLQGISKEVLVGIYLERSFEMVIAMLAVLKSGGAYVPLDPQLPAKRIEKLITISEIPFLITSPLYTDSITNKIHIIPFEREQNKPDLTRYSSRNHPCEIPQSGSPLAYVIYTSGTTGQPKGVMIEHASLVNSMYSINACLDHVIAPKASLLAVTPFSFDISCIELFGGICFGGKVIMCSTQAARDPSVIARLIQKYHINVMSATPATWQLLVEYGWEGAPDLVAICGGESLSKQLALNLQACCGQLWNMYGPTEATVYSLAKRIEAKPEKVTIGTALTNYYHYVLNEDKNIVPKGVVGELYIGGLGIARGYFKQPDLNAICFIHDPYSQDPLARLYKTGDLVRQLSDGEYDYIGRVDEQVKISGFRIELMEIENCIDSHPWVKKSCVSTYELLDSKQCTVKQIAAYVISIANTDKTLLIAALKNAIRVHLPSYMMPAAFIMLDTLPLSANGKIDKKQLPRPNTGGMLIGQVERDTEVEPTTELEHRLRSIWCALFNLKEHAVGVNVNFFELGGNSLLVVRLLSRIEREFGTTLTFSSIFEHATIRRIAKCIQALPVKKQWLRVMPVGRDNNTFPLSYAQQRLWFIDQMNQGSPEYNMFAVYRLKGPFNLDAAETAFQRIIQRHEPLRTTYHHSDPDSDPKKNKPFEESSVQRIQTRVAFQLSRYCFCHLAKEEQMKAIDKLSKAECHYVFNLAEDLMLRVSYVQLCDKPEKYESLLIVNLHHIAADGLSLDILIKEFSECYTSIYLNTTSSLKPLNCQYVDYAVWQRTWLKGEILDLQLGYWQKQLQGMPIVHSVPLDFARLPVKKYQGNTISGAISANLSKKLDDLALKYQLTPFMLYQGLLALLLSRHSNCYDIVIGTPVANRRQLELESLIGFFVNTLVLRTNTQHETLAGYFSHIKTVNLSALENQDVPFEYLVEHINAPRSTQFTPLFQMMFTMDENKESQFNIPEVSFSRVTPRTTHAKFDIHLHAESLNSSSHREVVFHWEYDASIFSEQKIAVMSRHFQQLLHALVDSPTEQISQLAMLSKKEVDHLIYDINNNAMVTPDIHLLHALFEQQASMNPDRAAIRFDGVDNLEKCLSWKVVNGLANQFARYLNEMGVEAGCFVGLMQDRSPDMIIAILAILKAGAAYVSLDPSSPDAQLAYMLDDCQPVCLLTRNLNRLSSLEFNQCTVINIENVLDVESCLSQGFLGRYSTQNLNQVAISSSGNAAYIVYTSGSTGKPKGIVQTHQTISNLVYACQANDGIERALCTLQFTPLTFDVSAQELATSWLTGSCLVLISQAEKENLRELTRQLGKRKIERLFIPPLVFDFICETLETTDLHLPLLKEVFVAGEALKMTPVIQRFLWLHSECALWNHYGPAETHVITRSRVSADAIEKPPIGYAIANTRLYLLNQQLQPVPMGCVAELYVSALHLPNGYIANEALTAEKFISNPLDVPPYDRLYRTGDLVRYCADGQLAFIGRVDEQIKIRGYRIEPGEIEYQLLKTPYVESSCVLAQQDQLGQNRLVAYIVKTKSASKSSMDEKAMGEKETGEKEIRRRIKAELQQQLMDYMIPAIFIFIKEIPLTRNGKIDKNRLPAPKNEWLHAAYIKPETAVEMTLCSIWSKLLNLPSKDISATANFFELGGHSLLSLRMISEVRSHFQIELSISTIFEFPCLNDIASQIEVQKTLLSVNNKKNEAHIMSEGVL